MKNVETPQYSEFRLNDVIGRLEGFRNTVGWGQLNEDLEIAIECIRYAAEVIEAESNAIIESINDILANQSLGKG